MKRAVVSLLGLVFVAGCQEDAKKKEDAKALAADKAALECEQIFSKTSCETAQFSDEDTCVTDLTEDYRAENDKFFDAGADYHGECADKGLESWPYSGRCQEICAVFTGPLAEGEDCDVEEGELCQQGLLCDDGRCKDPLTLIAVEGEPCAGGTSRVCAEGLACGSDGVCVAAPGVGAPCLTTSDGSPEICDTIHFCDDNGTCQEKRDVGVSCTHAAQCETFACDGGICTASTIEPTACWGLGTLYACN